MSRPNIADALTEAARTMNVGVTPEETLDAIVHAARDTVPGVDHVGISVAHPAGIFETMAPTDRIGWRLDHPQP